MIHRIITASIILILSSGAPGTAANPFLDYLEIFDYREIRENIRPAELEEFGKIRISGGVISYPENVLKLYIIASEVTDPEEIGAYMERFRSLKRLADEKLGKLSLNRYNTAEFLLHFLHDTMFRENQTGELSSYNIGIRETLDSGKFNCYKSALIYNGFLEYYGFSSAYVWVPNHIYSSVIIDEKPIDVETTNRFGFDPRDAGSPAYARKFHQKNVQLLKHSYGSKKPLDNFSVMTHVYVNRSNIYSGLVSYEGPRMGKNPGRAAALSVLGNYLNIQGDREIRDNMLYKIFLITQESLASNPGAIDPERTRYRKILDHPLFMDLRGVHLRNLEVALARAIQETRERRAAGAPGGDMKALREIFGDEISMARKYIEENIQVRQGTWNNSIAAFGTILEKRIPQNDLEGIMSYGRLMMDLLSAESLKENNFVEKYIRMYQYNTAAWIYNLGVPLVNGGEHARAHEIYTRAIRFLTGELRMGDEPIMQKIREIQRYNKEFLK